MYQTLHKKYSKCSHNIPVVINTPPPSQCMNPNPLPKHGDCSHSDSRSTKIVVALGYTELGTYRSRSSRCVCLQAASPLNADRLMFASPLHPFRGEDGSPWSLTSVAAISSPLSKSLLQGIGIAAVGDSLIDSAA